MTLFTCTETFAAIFCIFLLCYWKWNKNSPSICWPVLGMFPELLWNASRIHDYTTQILRKSGGTLHFKGPWFSGMNLILTASSDNMQYILSKNFENFRKGPMFKKIFGYFGDGILIADSDSWRTQRKLIHSLFKSNSFKCHVEKTSRQKVEDGMFSVLDHASKLGMEVDMQDLLHRLTFDLSCILLFSSDQNSLSIDLPKVPPAVAIDEIEQVVLYRHTVPERIWRLQNWLQIGEERKLTRACQVLDDFIYHQISLKREQWRNRTPHSYEIGNDNALDMVTSFIQEEERQPRPLDKISNTFMKDMVVNIYAAVTDTGSTALTWFFWIVATNPSIETSILTEMESKLQARERDPYMLLGIQELNKLVYLHAALCESLRLYPPVPFDHKAAMEADVLPSGHKVGPDMEVLFSPYAMGRMEEIWGEDCLEFKPERWISEEGEIIQVPSHKFIAFGAGPRTCVGKELAFIQMKIVAAAIVWNYHLQVAEGHRVALARSVILRMKGGLKLRVTKRTRNTN